MKRKGYTLLEVLAVSVLLAGFTVCFFEGVQMMGGATMSQQNRLEALMVTMGEISRWEVSPSNSWLVTGTTTVMRGTTVGTFGNGVGFTLTGRRQDLALTPGSWRKAAFTVQWREPVVGGSTSRVLTERRISVRDM